MILLTTVASPTVRRKAGAAQVADLFYSFQGEGPSFGRRALFARLMACNLTCGYAALPRTGDTPADGTMICDTEYTWNAARPEYGANADVGRNLGGTAAARPGHR